MAKPQSESKNTTKKKLTKQESEILSAAMRIIGSRTSEAKRRAIAENARKPRPGGRKPRKKLRDIECTCSGSGLNHRTYCPRGRAIRYRQARGLPMD
jgi:hypothetical protein